MVVSIFRARELRQALPFVHERHRAHIDRYMYLHRWLMIFFLLGYLFLLAAVMTGFSFARDLVLSLILFFGAIFVFIGFLLQSRLLSEMQNTLQGMVPICASCKKVRVKDGNYKDPRAWKRIEEYISERASVGFTHGYCPECYEKELKNVERLHQAESERNGNGTS
jgi:hypothetical protein